MSGLVR